jgi:hypothetical protein
MWVGIGTTFPKLEAGQVARGYSTLPNGVKMTSMHHGRGSDFRTKEPTLIIWQYAFIEHSSVAAYYSSSQERTVRSDMDEISRMDLELCVPGTRERKLNGVHRRGNSITILEMIWINDC